MEAGTMAEATYLRESRRDRDRATHTHRERERDKGRKGSEKRL
jgi:hypothetical protein